MWRYLLKIAKYWCFWKLHAIAEGSAWSDLFRYWKLQMENKSDPHVRLLRANCFLWKCNSSKLKANGKMVLPEIKCMFVFKALTFWPELSKWWLISHLFQVFFLFLEVRNFFLILKLTSHFIVGWECYSVCLSYQQLFYKTNCYGGI